MTFYLLNNDRCEIALFGAQKLHLMREYCLSCKRKLETRNTKLATKL